MGMLKKLKCCPIALYKTDHLLMPVFTILFPGLHTSQPLITFVVLFLSALRAHSGLGDASLISGPFPLSAQLFALLLQGWR